MKQLKFTFLNAKLPINDEGVQTGHIGSVRGNCVVPVVEGGSAEGVNAEAKL
jgi:hypothetical protein